MPRDSRSMALKSRKSVGLAVVTALLVGCGSNGGEAWTPPADAKERAGRVTFTVAYTLPEGAQELRLWMPYVTSNNHQAVSDVEVTGNFDDAQIYYEPENGNVVLYGVWSAPAAGVATLTYAFDITRSEMMRDAFPEAEPPMPTHATQYLGATSLGPVTGKVPTKAQEITAGLETVQARARAIYDYIVETGARDGEVHGCGVGDVNSLLDDLRGKCVDLSSVFVALARSIGIPAREIFGTRIAAAGDITGAYHCRAEFYLPGYGWVPVDPSDVRKLMLNEDLPLDDPQVQAAAEYYFGHQTETYVDFHTGRDIELNPVQDASALNYFMYPYAEVDGESLGLFGIYDEALTVTFEPQ